MTSPNGGLGSWAQKTTKECARENNLRQAYHPEHMKKMILRKSLSKTDSWNIDSLHLR